MKKIALVGCGRIMERHVEAIAANPGLAIVQADARIGSGAQALAVDEDRQGNATHAYPVEWQGLA